MHELPDTVPSFIDEPAPYPEPRSGDLPRASNPLLSPERRGRKPALDGLTPGDYEQVRLLASEGRSAAYIARVLGVSQATLANYCDPEYKHYDSELHDALEQGRLSDVAAVEDALRISALAGNFNAAKRYLSRRDPENWAEDMAAGGGNTVIMVNTGISRGDGGSSVTIDGVAFDGEEGDTEIVF